MTRRMLPRCPDCGGRVRMSAGRGRTREFERNVRLAIPDDFELPTCDACGEVLMIPEVSEPLDKLLGDRFRKLLQDELAWRNVAAGLFAVAVYERANGFEMLAGNPDGSDCIRKDDGDRACTCKWCKPVDAQKPAPA